MHLITVLGTGDYRKAKYQFVTCEECECREGCDVKGVSGRVGCRHVRESRYIQAATCDYYRDEIDKVTVFLTEKARSANWDDPHPNQNNDCSSDSGGMLQWLVNRRLAKSAGKQVILPDGTKIIPPPPNAEPKAGLRSELEAIGCGRFEIKDAKIKIGQDAEEIWDNFETVYGVIKEGEEIIFDLTHSFRSIPFLVAAVIQYARVLKGCTISAVQYGAFEAMDKESGTAPVFDMLGFFDVMDWTHAADSFALTGSSLEMRRLLAEKTAAEPNRGWDSFDPYVEAMDNLSKSLLSCRGSSEMSVRKTMQDKTQRSIQAASMQLEQANAELKANPIMLAGSRAAAQPLSHLLEYSYESFSELKKPENWEAGLAVAGWYSRHGMIPQGFIALEESIIEYACKKHGYEPNNVMEREIAKRLLKAKLRIKRGSSNGQSELLKYVNKSPLVNPEMQPGSQEAIELWQEFNKVNFDLAKVLNDIEKPRNSVSHFGNRLASEKKDAAPPTYDNLKGQLDTLCAKAREACSSPRTWSIFGFNNYNDAMFRDDEGKILYAYREDVDRVKGEPAVIGDSFTFELKKGSKKRADGKTLKYCR